jgi:PiT family inorganic phosphate transporter
MISFIQNNSLLIAFVGTALSFGFLNGFNDSANTVATMISSRAMSPRGALMLSTVAHLLAPFLFGVAVATTIGHEVVASYATTLPVVWSALLGAITWNLITWRFGIPSSSSHALIGGLLGATIMGFGPQSVLVDGLYKVLIVLLTSPILGMVVGYLLMRLILFFSRAATPRINIFFRRGQLVTAVALALSHGTNDAQMTMGIITMGLLGAGAISRFMVPGWVIAACAVVISLGTSLGGWRIIRTLGGRFYKIRPVHSFTSQFASALIILGAALIGGPVSTSHVVSTTILSAGAAERVSKVRWGVMRSIVVAWVLTIPSAAAAAALFYSILEGRI